MPYDTKLSVVINILRQRQNGCQFPDDIFKCIFLNENVWILIRISLKYIPKGQINNIPALFQIMVWRQTGDKPLVEPMMISLLKHVCITHLNDFNTVNTGNAYTGLILGLSPANQRCCYKVTLSLLGSIGWPQNLESGLHIWAKVLQHNLMSKWHQEMETLSALLALYEGNSPVIKMWSSDVSFDVSLDKLLDKQSSFSLGLNALSYLSIRHQ